MPGYSSGPVGSAYFELVETEYANLFLHNAVEGEKVDIIRTWKPLNYLSYRKFSLGFYGDEPGADWSNDTTESGNNESQQYGNY